MQTPEVTWGGLSCNCLRFCTHNLFRRTATRVYIIQEVNTHVHSLSTEYNVCFSTQLGLRVPARASDATTRVRINAGGGCPLQTRLQSTGSTQDELQVLDHTVYRAHEVSQKPTRRPNAIAKVPRGFAVIAQCPLCARVLPRSKHLSAPKS